MENASKALIIAGAILLSILIIAIGMYIYTSAQAQVNNSLTNMNTSEIEGFNSTFSSYEGVQTGSSCKALIGRLISNANTYKEEPTESGKDDESDYKSVEEDSKAEYSNSTYSEYEIDLIARTTYLESGNCGEYCQWLTASTILNLADNRGGVANVVYDYNTFNVAGMIDGCSPSDLSYSVARRVASGDRDYNVMAFRASYYHSFGTPYTSADNVYFSTY